MSDNTHHLPTYLYLLICSLTTSCLFPLHPSTPHGITPHPTSPTISPLPFSTPTLSSPLPHPTHHHLSSPPPYPPSLPSPSQPLPHPPPPPLFPSLLSTHHHIPSPHLLPTISFPSASLPPPTTTTTTTTSPPSLCHAPVLPDRTTQFACSPRRQWFSGHLHIAKPITEAT
ncbi:hypothetical protein Pmani_016471 [Petrolisthes manimaculis]|uniref:Uncharacterized protein n=1 Tax=Petrolisthes manimaculis TaxID=1843537 RepID=A0AAE1PQ10_9EUCA|nr:hypothetical protein Pmani_016471 [Petrolisthes manimaculis]